MRTSKNGKKQVDENGVVLHYRISRYIMIAVAVVSFAGSLIFGVAGMYAWKEQQMNERLLASAQSVHAMYSAMDLPLGQVLGVSWNEYSDEENGYSFMYPSNWHVSKGDEEASNALVISTSEDSQEEAISAIRIEIDDFAGNPGSLESVVKESAAYSDGYAQREYLVGGQPGILLSRMEETEETEGAEKTEEAEETETYGGTIFASCGNTLYRMSWVSSTAEAAAEYGFIMEGIVDTVTFLTDCTVTK